MAEIYIVRDIKVAITSVLYTPLGNRFRLGSNFVSTSIQNEKYILCIYSGKQRFIEIGFSDRSVYKMLRFIFKLTNLSKIIIKIMEFCNAIRTN